MKVRFLLLGALLSSATLIAQNTTMDATHGAGTYKHLYLDVHQLQPGKVKFQDVAGAHAKDLVTEKKYGTDFQKYWVDEKKGLVYCLVAAPDTQAIRKTHAEAHGLLPNRIYEVTDGDAAAIKNGRNLFLDTHYLGAGKVTAADVAGAHAKDLQVQNKYGVSFVNYWVNEREGVVMCLVEAKDSASIVRAHKEAHGLLPARVSKVKQGE